MRRKKEMSIRLMSAIFETELADLPYRKGGEDRKAKASTCKLLLLAIADHANDEGESAYPGYERLERKTALSRQGIADTLDALKQNNMITVSEVMSKLGTNNYTVNLNALTRAESSHLTRPSQATGLPRVKPLDLNHPLTTIKPSTTTAHTSNNYQTYEQNIGPLTPLIADAIKDAEETFTAAWVSRAIAEAAASNARSIKYIFGILAGYKQRGSPDISRSPAPARRVTTQPAKLDIDAILGVTR